MPSDWTIRDLRPRETELLRLATLTNMNWSGEQRFSFRDLDMDPALRHYYAFDADRGDLGFVAMAMATSEATVVLGVVWLLFLDSTDPGYGFVADGVPELSVCVWPGYRGLGIGRALIDHALVEAGSKGIRRVSLSVEDGNPAVNLYLQRGFAPVPGASAGTLSVSL
ncbi:GNAT family N-acetyltransferase [Citricoccus sp. NPDC055426]|uniref:GNAT family N-acetyltransferase n=1 Tax=Citricoccus sp. NPDC055426 TaxID=3155536 RepID=UPI003421CF7C